MAPFFFKSQSQPQASGSGTSSHAKDASTSKKKVKPSTANGQLAPSKSFFSLSNSSRQKLAALDPLSPSMPTTPTLQQQQPSPTSPCSGTSSDVYPYPHSLLDERELYPSPGQPQLTRSTSAEPPPSRLNPARLLRRKASGKRKDKERERERDQREAQARDEEQLAPEDEMWHRRNGSNGSLVHSTSLQSFRAASPIDMQYRPQAGFHGRRPSASGSALNLAPSVGGVFVQETLSSPVMMHHFGSAASLALGYTGSIRSTRSDDSKRLPIPFIHDGDMVVSEVIEHPFLNAGAGNSAPATTITPSTSTGAPSIRAPSPSPAFGLDADPSPPRRRGGNPPPPLRPQPSLSAFPRSSSPAGPQRPSGARAQSPMLSDAEEPRITAEWLARKPSTRRRVQPSFTSLARDDRPPPERRGSDGRAELGRIERAEPPTTTPSSSSSATAARDVREDRRGSDGRDRARGSGGTVSSISGGSAEDAIMTPVLSPRLSGLPGPHSRTATFPPQSTNSGPASPYASGSGLGAGLNSGFYSQKAGSTSSLRLPVEKHPRACSPSERRDLRNSRDKPTATPPMPSLPSEHAGYEVSVQCVSAGDEVRWEVVMRRSKGSAPVSQLTLGKEAATATAPQGAGSVSLNLSLDLEQPSGKMTFLSPSGESAHARTPSMGVTSPRSSRLDGSLPPLPAKDTVREKEAPLPPLPVALPLPPPQSHAHSHSFSGRGHTSHPSLAHMYGNQNYHPAHAFQPLHQQSHSVHHPDSRDKDAKEHHRPLRPLPIPVPAERERSQLPYAQPYSPQTPTFASPPLVLEPAAPVERHPNRAKVLDENAWREYRSQAA